MTLPTNTDTPANTSRARRARAWLRGGPLRRAGANSVKLVGGRSANAVFGLITLGLAIRALGVDTYGVLVLIHTYALVVARIAKFQSWQAVLRFGAPAFEAARYQELHRLLKFTALLDGGSACLAAAAAVVGGLALGTWLGWPPGAAPFAAAYGMVVVFMVIGTPIGVLRLLERFDLLALRNAAEGLIRLIGASLAFGLGGGLGAFLLAWFIARAAASLFTMYAARRELRRRHLPTAASGWRRLHSGFTGIWGFVGATNLNTTVGLTFGHLGTLAVGALLGASDAALYHVARQLSQAVAKPTRLLIPTIYPEIAKLVPQNATRELGRLVWRATCLAGVDALLSLVVLIIFGPWLLQLLGGGEVQSAYAVMLLLAGSALLLLWWFPLEPLLISAGWAGTALRARLAGLVCYIPVLLGAVHWLGLPGAGIAAIAAALATVAMRGLAVVSWFRHQRAEPSA